MSPIRLPWCLLLAGLAYVYQVNANGCGNVANFVLSRDGNYCFNYVPNGKIWPTCSVSCLCYGGKLVTLESAEKAQQLEYYMSDNGFEVDEDVYVGGTDVMLNSKWVWTQNRVDFDNYTNWADNKPSDQTGYSCLSIKPQPGNYKWTDKDCGNVLKYICQRDPS